MKHHINKLLLFTSTSAHRQFTQKYVWKYSKCIRMVWCMGKVFTIRFVTHSFQKADKFISEYLAV